jgi:hypothetical protein
MIALGRILVSRVDPSRNANVRERVIVQENNGSRVTRTLYGFWNGSREQDEVGFCHLVSTMMSISSTDARCRYICRQNVSEP